MPLVSRNLNTIIIRVCVCVTWGGRKVANERGGSTDGIGMIYSLKNLYYYY